MTGGLAGIGLRDIKLAAGRTISSRIPRRDYYSALHVGLHDRQSATTPKHCIENNTRFWFDVKPASANTPWTQTVTCSHRMPKVSGYS